LLLRCFSSEKDLQRRVAVNVGRIDLAAVVEEQGDDVDGSGEGGPVQGHVLFRVSNARVGLGLEQIPDRTVPQKN